MRWLIGYLFSLFVNKSPRTVVSLMSLVGRFSPLISLGSSLFVLRADDIKEVLGRPDDFEVGPVAGKKMLLGPFLLGMDPWPEYVDMHGELRKINVQTLDGIQHRRAFIQVPAIFLRKETHAPLGDTNLLSCSARRQCGSLRISAERSRTSRRVSDQ